MYMYIYIYTYIYIYLYDKTAMVCKLYLKSLNHEPSRPLKPSPSAEFKAPSNTPFPLVLKTE